MQKCCLKFDSDQKGKFSLEIISKGTESKKEYISTALCSSRVYPFLGQYMQYVLL